MVHSQLPTLASLQTYSWPAACGWWPIPRLRKVGGNGGQREPTRARAASGLQHVHEDRSVRAFDAWSCTSQLVHLFA